jgi:hypothetical protein
MQNVGALGAPVSVGRWLEEEERGIRIPPFPVDVRGCRALSSR